MRFDARNIALIILGLIVTLLALSLSQVAHGQDTLKVQKVVIEGAKQDIEFQIEQVLSGKTAGNVYYLQGQADILKKLLVIGTPDTVKADTLKTAKGRKK